MDKETGKTHSPLTPGQRTYVSESARQVLRLVPEIEAVLSEAVVVLRDSALGNHVHLERLELHEVISKDDESSNLLVLDIFAHAENTRITGWRRSLEKSLIHSLTPDGYGTMLSNVIWRFHYI